MKILVILTTLLSTSVFAQTLSAEMRKELEAELAKRAKAEVEIKDCRTAVVDAKKVLGDDIDPNSFSTMGFTDLNMSAEDFNALTPEVQADYYQKVKPLEVMVEETISDLNGRIDYYSNSFYAFFMIDEIQEMRDSRDELRACTL
jgi:hypothetical protein